MKGRKYHQRLINGWPVIFAIALAVVSGVIVPVKGKTPVTRERDLPQKATFPCIDSPMAAGDSMPPVLYMIDDTIGSIKQLNPADIGIMEIVGKRRAEAPDGDGAGIVRIYTKKFIKMHPTRFPDQQVMRADTIKTEQPPEN